jgi:phosphotransferase system enzyme I (PtsI)
LNVEFVLFDLMQDLVQKLESVSDDYLRERTADLHDVGKRIINNLMVRDRVDMASLEDEVILVCHDLMPSDAIAMDKVKVKGIAMDAGGKTSHTAIIARAFEIPAVLGLGNISERVNSGDYIIIDGFKGLVLLDPDRTAREEYLRRLHAAQKRDIQLMRFNELAAETRDGKVLSLKANIEIPEEVDAADTHGADGIGLYRSEFLFMRSDHLPDEQEQFDAYSRVLAAMKPRPVTIRTLDLGGDKLMNSLQVQGGGEKNPILGWRAIRFCLSHVDIFRTQLRALLRASIHGNLRIMIPLISSVAELREALALIEAVKHELENEKIPFSPKIPTGIMIEVPSAAMTTDLLARHAKFFSIGTNDLIQYTLAVDRGNEHVAYLYDPLHLGILRSLKMIIQNAHNAGISVGMCGEMAGDPLYTLILLGLGLDEFSMSSFGIPRIKQIIRSTSILEAEEFVGRVMELESSEAIAEFVSATMEERFEISG